LFCGTDRKFEDILNDVLLLNVFYLSETLESIVLMLRNGTGNLRRGAFGLILISDNLYDVGMSALSIW
jgi:hypothetical protein